MITIAINARGNAYFKDCPSNCGVSDIIDTMFVLVEELPPQDRGIMEPLLKTWCTTFHSYEWDSRLGRTAFTEIIYTRFGNKFVYSANLIHSVD